MPDAPVITTDVAASSRHVAVATTKVVDGLHRPSGGTTQTHAASTLEVVPDELTATDPSFWRRKRWRRPRRRQGRSSVERNLDPAAANAVPKPGQRNTREHNERGPTPAPTQIRHSVTD